MSFADLTQTMSTVVFGVLGEPVTLLRENADPCIVTGLFKADHEIVDVSTGVAVSTMQPVLEVQAVDVPGGVDGIEEGDHVEVQSMRYLIVDVQPDGHGTLKLFLHRAGHKTGHKVVHGGGGEDDDN